MIPSEELYTNEYYMHDYHCPLSSQFILDRIINYWNERYHGENRSKLEDILHRAYIGSKGSWQPISDETYGKGKPYGLMIKKSGLAYSHPLKLYYPRGLWPITWYEGYEAASLYTRYNLLEYPELLMQPSIAVEALVEGYFYGLKRNTPTQTSLNLVRDI